MRIHTNILTSVDLMNAATLARVEFDRYSRHRSHSHERAFTVTLTGESKRRPNFGTSKTADRFDSTIHAATWDQWGVFLAHLFEVDPNMLTPYYVDAIDFADQTADRFGAPEDEMTDHGYVRNFRSYGWPEDAHGDHTFKFVGIPRSNSCTKCTAARHWGRGAAQRKVS